MASLRLYGEPYWISPYVFTCFVGLREKGLAFETEEVPLHQGGHLLPAYRDRSITAKVPALEHDGFWLAESSAIVEYLDERFSGQPRLLPSEVRERGRARQVMAWIRSDLLALREERPTTTMFYERATAPLSPAGQAAAEKLLRVADLLVGDGATTIFGAWSIADADLAFMLHRLVLNGHEVGAKLAAFAAAQWARPTVRAFVEQPRPPTAPRPL